MILEDYKLNNEIWFHGSENELKLRKPSLDSPFFATIDPEYACEYGYVWSDKNPGYVYFLTLSNKLKVFDFEADSYNACKKYGWPEDFARMILDYDLYNVIKIFFENREIENSWSGEWVEARKEYSGFNEWFINDACKKLDTQLYNAIMKQYNSCRFDYSIIWKFIGHTFLADLQKSGYNAFVNNEMKHRSNPSKSIGIFNISAIDEIAVKGIASYEILYKFKYLSFKEQQQLAKSMII